MAFAEIRVRIASSVLSQFSRPGSFQRSAHARPSSQIIGTLRIFANAHHNLRDAHSPLDCPDSGLGALRELNPNQPASEFQPVQRIVDRAVSPRRFFMLMVLCFAALGLTLAALGIYGVISYSVNQRTLEIGIRMALGATHNRVQLDVIRRTLWLAFAGIGVGTIASIAVARGIASLLFGTQPTDPLTFTGMVLLLGTIALLAGYLSARRASRVQPMAALRSN